MARLVPCTGCPATFRVPGSVFGKQIRCPRCSEVVDVPVREEGDDTHDNPRRSRDTAEEAPRRPARRRRPPPRRSPTTLIVAIAVGLVTVAGIVMIAVSLSRKDAASTPVAQTPGQPRYPKPEKSTRPPTAPASPAPQLSMRPSTPVPGDWKLFTHTGAGVQAYLPGPPIPRGGTSSATGPDGDRSSRTFWDFAASGTGPEAGLVVRLWVVEFSHGPPQKLSQQIEAVAPPSPPNVQGQRVRWLGQVATEVELGTAVLRIATVGNRLVAGMVVGRGDARAQPGELAGFFDNVQLLR